MLRRPRVDELASKLVQKEGSGKSTTLASMIGLVNRSMPKHIVTVEDPIEFLHEDV